jgi:hypothetical protein
MEHRILVTKKTIGSCSSCDYMSVWVDDGSCCGHPALNGFSRPIDNANYFADFCPLPKAEERI